MIKVLLDTNVLISGLFWPGQPHRVLQLARLKVFQSITSEALIQELRDILTRLDKSFHMAEEDAEKVSENVKSWSQIVSIGSVPKICRDVKDNVVLATAVTGGVDYLVTGDDDLLSLQSYAGVKIVTVGNFLQRL